jgi:serine protease Do
MKGAAMIGRFWFVVSNYAAGMARYASLRSLIAATVCGGAVILVPITGSTQQNARQPADRGAGPNVTQQAQTQVSIPLPSLSPLVEMVSPAVVNVSVVMGAEQIAESSENEAPGFPQSPFDEFLRRFFEQQGIPESPTRPRPRGREGQAVAQGSGFVIDPDGRIVTNNHVVGNAEKVTIVFQDNSKQPAQVVGRDEKTDIALLKIETDKPLPFVAWGDSDATKVGDWVVAVGNPFGLGGTVTAGIVSALGRNIEAGPYDDFLQIDAPINRGNSGGPTFNLNGQVIGINTAIYSPTGGSVGIGFAVPSNLAKNVIAQLSQHGQVTRGWLGVQIQRITPEIARGLGLPPDKANGALVADVTDNSPAAEAGLRPGDVITRFNGKAIKDVHDLPRRVAETPIGQVAEINVLRGGKEMPLNARIAELKEPPKLAAASSGGSAPPARPKQRSALGMQLSELSEEMRQRTGSDANGVAVISVSPDSPASGLVEPGDVIVAVNQEPVTDPAQAADKLNAAAAKKQALLLVNHRGTNRFVGLPLT